MRQMSSLQVEGGDGVADRLGGLARRPEADNIPSWLADIDTMRENFAVNINRKIAADALFVSMASN